MGRPRSYNSEGVSTEQDIEEGMEEEDEMMGLDRTEFILLLEQGLRDHGFEEVAEELETLSVSFYWTQAIIVLTNVPTG